MSPDDHVGPLSFDELLSLPPGDRLTLVFAYNDGDDTRDENWTDSTLGDA